MIGSNTKHFHNKHLRSSTRHNTYLLFSSFAMRYGYLFLFVLAFPTIVAHERHLEEESSSVFHRCGTALPTAQDFLAREHASRFREFLEDRNPEFRLSSMEIPVCFHIPRRENHQNDTISNEQLQEELDHLNRAFTNASCCDTELEWCLGNCSLDTGLSFVMATLDENGSINGTTNSTSDPTACISRPFNRRWMSVNVSFLAILRREGKMKRALRKGDESVLNVYYTAIRTRTSLRNGLLGYATLPNGYADHPALDGVVINRGAIRGGSISAFNEGDTLVHEVGHWLGLFHTFQGRCERGDGIGDTAPEKSPNSGCSPQDRRDTCPGDGKLDPIFNFMDYSSDSCLYEFTEGQISVMVNSYLAYRSPVSRSARNLRAIQTGFHESGSLDTDSTQVFEMNDVPKGSVVHCHVETTDDDEKENLDILVNSHGRFRDFECISEISDGRKSCSVHVSSDKLYVFVHATSTVFEFAVLCKIDGDLLLE